jgi:hypothetical protein
MLDGRTVSFGCLFELSDLVSVHPSTSLSLSDPGFVMLPHDVVAQKMLSELMGQENAIGDRMKRLEKKWSIIKKKKNKGNGQ